MKLIWFKNKTDKDKERFRNLLLGSREVLEELSKILSEKEQDLIRSNLTTESYDTPNWSYLQAHKNGYLSCLSAIKDLVNLDQKDSINK